jgi:hypothetical protein
MAQASLCHLLLIGFGFLYFCACAGIARSLLPPATAMPIIRDPAQAFAVLWFGTVYGRFN